MKMDAPDLPDILPIFPLSGVLLLPRGQLPLNVFEPRYLSMVEDALQSHRMIGIIQPLPEKEQTDKPAPLALYKTGCAGKITSFSETDDGRFLVTLTGICRFRIAHEMPELKGYRSVSADWSDYAQDHVSHDCLGLDRSRLLSLLHDYFQIQDLSCDWDAVKQAPDEKLMTCLAMICPFAPEEKQALLEAPCCKSRAEVFMTMLEMHVHDAHAGCEHYH